MKQLDFSLQNRFFPGSQAFASPPDMASSGVREDVYLTITPPFDGVCGMLFLIILVGIFCQMLACIPYIVYIFWLFFANYFGCWMWQMLLSLLVWNQWIFLADVVCHIIISWLMFVAIVADVNATLFVCRRWKPHWMMFLLIVADVITTIWIGWCYCHSGGWNYHILNGLMFLPNAADGTATYVTADKFVYCGRWNGHFVTGWCYCHTGRWNGHWLECF